MASALHIYANLLWRDNKVDARIKKVAALRLLQEQHYRLHLDELSRALVSRHGSSVSGDVLAPAQLADIITTEGCFVYSDGTGNVLLDAAALMKAGKDCLKAQIDRVWNTSSPLSWARNQLAWCIVSRQRIGTRAADLFLASVEDAESFLAAAWTSRVHLRNHPDQPYTSLHHLLGGETRFELTPDQSAIRLNFIKLLQPQQETYHPPPGAPLQPPPSLPPPPPQQQHGVNASGRWHEGVGDGRRGAADAACIGAEWGDSCCGEGYGAAAPAAAVAAMTESTDIAAPATAAALRGFTMSSSSSYSPSPSSLQWPSAAAANGGAGESQPPAGFRGQGQHGSDGGTGGRVSRDANQHYEEAEEYGDGGDEYGDDHNRDIRGAVNRAAASGCGGGAGSAAVAGRYANGNGGGPAALNRPILPLRPDLLQQYIRAVFAASGSPRDALMVVVALALVDAGRSGAGQGGGNLGRSAAAASHELHRFHMQLPRLVAHVRDTVPHLLQLSSPAAAAAGSLAAGMTYGALLLQRLQERPGRGCFRVLVVPESGGVAAPGPGAAGQGGCVRDGGSGGDVGEVEEAVVVLDLEVLRERVVEALEAAAGTVFSGNRPVDEIRRTVAVHLASRTRPFGGRVHCMRLITLARALAEVLPSEVFDPNRLGGFERLICSESSNNVMHVFRKVMPEGLAGQGQGQRAGEKMGTFVTLNLGKLLSSAGIRDLDCLAGPRSAHGGSDYGDGGAEDGGGGGSGRDGSGRGAYEEAATVAPGAAASVRGSRDPQTPTLPSDAVLRQAVEALFSLPDSSRGGGNGGGEYALAAAAAKRTAALSLVRALHSQQGGFLSFGRLTDVVLNAVPGAPDLERLLSTDPDLFEIQEGGYGSPRSVRLRVSGVMARAAASAAEAAASGTAAAGTAGGGSLSLSLSPPHSGSATASESLPRRPNTMNCPYYMRYGKCGFGRGCKYNHPQLTPCQPAEMPALPAAEAAAASATAVAPHHHRPPAAATYQPQPQPQQQLSPPATATAPQVQVHSRHLHSGGHDNAITPPTTAASPVSAAASAVAPVAASAPTAAAAHGATDTTVPAAAAAPPPLRLSPTTLEVKVVTTACTPDHLDMLQHCYAASQVAVACKVRRHATAAAATTYPLTHTQRHLAAATVSGDGGELNEVCLVQLYAPEVAAVNSGGGGGGNSRASTTGTASGPGGDGLAGTASGGGGAGATTATAVAVSAPPRWPATVYLVDPAAGKDTKGLLLPSLSPLLEDPAVPKIIYCSSEVVPYMPHISPVYDISVLHTLIAGAHHVVLGTTTAAAVATAAGKGSGGGAAATASATAAAAAVPPLATLLQHNGMVTTAGAAAATVAPAHSPLWASRPLSAELRLQAVLDVVHLASLWTALVAKLMALPQELSQERADRLLLAHSSSAAGAAVVPPASSASAPAAVSARMRPTPSLGSGSARDQRDYERSVTGLGGHFRGGPWKGRRAGRIGE